MLKKISFIIFVLLTLICVNVSDINAQEGNVAEVKEIVVEGNQRVESDTIKTFLPVKVGSRYSDSELNSALDELFATGLFSDVKIRRTEGIVTVEVVENPIINELVFEGNKRIEDEDLTKETSLKPRDVYTKTALQKDVRRILDLYQKSGRFSAIVTPKVITLEQNRVNVVFEIDEGSKTEISKINFVGNKNFSDETLRNTIQTKESRWYRFFSSDDAYDPDRLAFDQELLRRLYIANGFADFRVTSATAELTPERESFIITFSIEEGDVYTFGDMGVESQIAQVSSDQVSGLVLTNKGEKFNAELMDKTIEKMTQYLGDLGYAFVDIKPQISRNTETDIIGIVYQILEAPRVYVEKINIKGNSRTLDEVVRREFRVAEGDPYNASKIKRSQQRIQNLGYFKKADITTDRGSAEDKVEINVDVEEQSTGELTIGAGFSTADGALGDISLSERNLLGKGQQLRLNLTLAASRRQVDLGFTEPYFLDKNVAAGFDIFSTKRDGQSSTSSLSYDLDSVGGALRAEYPLSEHLSHFAKYSLRSDNITDVDSDASTFIRQQEGKNTTSMVSNSLQYDTRDSKFDPKNGYIIRYNFDVAGLGGDSKFVRNEIRSGYFIPTFNEDWVFKMFGKVGNIVGLAGEDVRINNRFFLGSTEVRGFNNEGIGPRDTSTKDPLGGNFYYAGTVEQSFPLGVSKDFGLSGSVFSDFGSLFDVDDTGANIKDSDAIRVSVGAGVSWLSPVGPIRIDFAEALVKENFDETEQIRFSFGTKF